MDNRRHPHVVLLLCCMCLFTCIICKKQKKPRNQILCRTNDAKCKAVQLICPDHSVIYNPDVFVDTADCGENIQCRGLTPMLLMERSNCFWTKKCIIQFPIQSIFIGCMNYSVRCLRVLDWKCIPERNAAKGFYWTDICDLNDSIIIGGGSIDRGIIRSHSIMPWSYDKSVLNNQSLCRRELHPTSKQSVIITVDGINDTGIINDVIDVDNDVGYITDKDTYYNISDIVWKTKHFPVGKPVYINFGSGETKGASGFIICFKFTNEAVKSTKSVCDDIYVGDKKSREFKRKKKKRCREKTCSRKRKNKKPTSTKTKRKNKRKQRKGQNRRKKT